MSKRNHIGGARLSWLDVERGVAVKLERNLDLAPTTQQSIELKSWRRVTPTNLSDPTKYEFRGGRRIRWRASSNTRSGFEGYAWVYSLNAGGGVIPDYRATPGILGGTTADFMFGGHTGMIGARWEELEASFESAHGYFWRVVIVPRVVSGNQGYDFIDIETDGG